METITVADFERAFQLFLCWCYSTLRPRYFSVNCETPLDRVIRLFCSVGDHSHTVEATLRIVNYEDLGDLYYINFLMETYAVHRITAENGMSIDPDEFFCDSELLRETEMHQCLTACFEKFATEVDEYCTKVSEHFYGIIP